MIFPDPDMWALVIGVLSLGTAVVAIPARRRATARNVIPMQTPKRRID